MSRSLRTSVLTIFLSITGNLPAADDQAPAQKPVDASKPSLEQSTYMKWDMMIGKWLGEAPTKEGGVRRWLVNRFSDGTYRIHFQTMRRNAVVENRIEVGNWGISGPVYFSIYRGRMVGNVLRNSDPGDPYNHDAYEILELSEDRFRYRHYETQNEYEIRKVPDEYRLPGAEGA